MDKLKSIKINNKKNNISIGKIANFLNAIIFYYKTNYFAYSNADNIIEKIHHQFSESFSKSKLKNNKITFTWHDMIKVYNFLKESHSSTLSSYTSFIILSLCKYFPRNFKDFVLIKVSNDEINLSPNFNYFINTNNPYFIFNQHGANQIYNTQYFYLPARLALDIKCYIFKFKITDSLLICDDKGSRKIIDVNYFTKSLISVFKKYHDPSFSFIDANTIRNIFIDYLESIGILDNFNSHSNNTNSKIQPYPDYLL